MGSTPGYSKKDFHAEFLWIPVPTVDEIGKPGGIFIPARFEEPPDLLRRTTPDATLELELCGPPVATHKRWRYFSGFYYHSLDAASTFYRVSGSTEPLVFQPRQDQID
jgi:hypothetical protein